MSLGLEFCSPPASGFLPAQRASAGSHEQLAEWPEPEARAGHPNTRLENEIPDFSISIRNSSAKSRRLWCSSCCSMYSRVASKRDGLTLNAPYPSCHANRCPASFSCLEEIVLRLRTSVARGIRGER